MVLDLYAPIDQATYWHFMNWIDMHHERKPPIWAIDFIEQCNDHIDKSIQVHLVPCAELFVSKKDWNSSRVCQPDWVPCMQLSTRAIFYPMPDDKIDRTAWKLGLLHEFAHLYPPNPTHDEGFKEQYEAFCSLMRLPHEFIHVRGHLY